MCQKINIHYRDMILYLNPELSVRRKSERVKKLDCLVEMEGELVNLEVNLNSSSATRNRNFNYFTSFYNSITSKGNKALTNPIGLITADEYALAGGAAKSSYYNTTFWLHTGEHYWTWLKFNLIDL